MLLALVPLARCHRGDIRTEGLVSPTVYHYMVEVPGAYSVNWPRAVKVSLGALARFAVVPASFSVNG